MQPAKSALVSLKLLVVTACGLATNTRQLLLPPQSVLFSQMDSVSSPYCMHSRSNVLAALQNINAQCLYLASINGVAIKSLLTVMNGNFVLPFAADS